MTTETVAKKRGRPRKTDKVDPTPGKQGGEAAVTTPKRSTTARSITTTKTSSKEATSKKPARRKKLTEIDEIEATSEQFVDEVNPSSTAQEMNSEAGNPPSESRILNEAKAFKELKASTATSVQISAVNGEQLEVTSSSTGPPEDSISPQSASHSLRPARTTITSAPPPPPPSINSSSSPPPPSKPVKNDATRSSFLSGFLSDAPDPTPEAPESSKITDRSAFKSQPLSIDEIISGAGVSDLTSLTAAIQQKANVKQERESAIPIAASKSFKSHSLNVFPDKAQHQKVKTPSTQKYIKPETYALGSFQSFKASPQAAPAPSSSTINSSSVATSTKQSPHIPPTSVLSQLQSKSQPSHQHQRATLQTSSSPNPPNQQQTTPSKPSPSPSPSTPTPTTPSSTRLPKPPIPTQIPTTQPHPTSPPQFRPKRPTEMTPAELLKNPEFKSLRRKYTGLIVGIPVLVVTSWLLWDRMDREDKGVSGGEFGSGVGVAEERKRARGELPRRILDDGGLERGR